MGRYCLLNKLTFLAHFFVIYSVNRSVICLYLGVHIRCTFMGLLLNR